MVNEKNPDANLKLAYRKVLELGLVGALMFMLVLFQTVPQFAVVPENTNAKAIEIMVEDIPPTEQIKQAPPPPRPSIPIPSESEDIPEDVTIEATALDLSDIPLPPPPPDDDMYGSYVFIPYDEPPTPIGGFAAIQKNLKYPEIGRKTGIEALVVVGVLIDEKGRVIKTQILNDVRHRIGFEEAAIAAIKKVKWHPAKQRDKPMKVWVTIPVRFALSAGQGGT